ncbi:MAG TPA: HAD-IIA family hydrolase [Gemmatimonadales bacterium]|nr:HAD-IIA family hydrolase [Gemmatimonadales bacterium]
MTAPKAWCFDLDGTLYQGDAAIPGAAGVLAALRRADIPFRCVSNTTSRSRRLIGERLARYGLDVAPEEIFTATRAGASWLARAGVRRAAPFVPREALEDLADFTLVGGTSGSPASGPVDAIVLGDLGREWADAFLQEAFTHLMAGAKFLALSRDRYWHDGVRLTMDCGGYVAALEYATGRESVLAGKPSAEFYRQVLASFGDGMTAAEVIMVGDDVRSDVGGAQAAGMRGWLVETGKFNQGAVTASGIAPDRIIPSIAEVAG